MKKVYCFIGFLIFVFVAAAFSSDVADVAKKEKERRAKIKGTTKTYTNQDVEEHKKKNNISDSGTQTEPATDEQATADSDQATQTQEDTNSEEYWRNRRKELADKVAELQAEFDRVQANLNQLQTALSASGSSQLPGDAAGDTFRAQMAQRDQLKQQLDDAKAALDGLEDEARKAGVPPGWVRE